MRRFFSIVLGLGIVLVLGVLAVIWFDAPAAPPPMASVEAPFRAVNFADLPPVETFQARDGAALAFRRYAGDPDRRVILIHGSSGSSTSMHATAKALQAAGATVIAVDLRGHGHSGPPGDIAYIGQLEDDLEDLLKALDSAHAPRETTLIGFSSGGGFALRVLGGRLAPHFQRAILLAPYLRYDSPVQRPASGGWIDVSVPRLVAIGTLHQLGITAFDALPVLAFAVPPGNPHHQTPSYSYRLLINYQPDNDYLGDLKRAPPHVMAIDGADDEMFYADKLAPTLHQARPDMRVTIVPGVGHITLVTTPVGTAAIADAWKSDF